MRNTGLEEAQAGFKIAGEILITSDMQMSNRNLLYLETVVRPLESPAEVRFAAVFVKEKK